MTSLARLGVSTPLQQDGFLSTRHFRFQEDLSQQPQFEFRPLIFVDKFGKIVKYGRPNFYRNGLSEAEM